MCEQSNFFNCNSFDDCIENDDWRPSQELLLTRFAAIEYSDMFRTINQDYGSFYHRQTTSPCIPDRLTEKVHRRQERFMDWLYTQTSQQLSSNTCRNNLFSEQNIETLKITHRKKLSACHIDDVIIDFLVKQIQYRLRDLIDPCDYPDVLNCARILIIDLLNQYPSLCTEDVINRVIGMMNTPSCYPVTPPSSSFFPVTNSTTLNY
ncbi:hypothetical protein I4U23_024548 [Adineta vaga]|nr:hypothetical protein I4U23_024548 [Adineta vaga]